MENFFIEGTDRTPEISFNVKSGVLAISGRSITENPISFYKKLEEIVLEYGENPKPNTSILVTLEYFNTSTSKCLVDLFKLFEPIHAAKSKVLVEWFYEQDDEEIMDSGEDYKDFINIPFEIKLLN